MNHPFLPLFCILLLTLSLSAVGQSDSAIVVKEIQQFQKELDAEYKDPAKSPLEPKALKRFKTHNYYPINLKYHVMARFVRTKDEKVFSMTTTTDRRPEYVKYGEVHFILDNQPCKLNVYQSLDLLKKEEYKDYLFIPFTDLTNGEETYEGGRFLDLKIPPSDTMVIDFNKAYNPYCVYSHRYSCPIPPRENHLEVAILAGLQKTTK